MYTLTITASTVKELRENVKDLFTQLTYNETEAEVYIVKTNASEGVKNVTAKVKVQNPQVDIEELIEEAEEKPKAKKKIAKKTVEADIDEVEDIESEINEDEITPGSVKKLAQEKIGSGAIDRADVKRHVTKLGGSQISDLNSKALAKLTEILEAA